MSAESLDEELPRQRGPYRKGLARRAEIVRAASQTFAEHGYAGGSIRTIAAEVGVSPATLLQHFGSKQGLLEAVLQDWDKRTDPAGYHRVRGLAFMDRQLRGGMQFHIEHRGLIELFLTMAAEATNLDHPARQFIQERYTTNLADLAEAFREAIADGEIAPMTEDEIAKEARLLFATMDGIELQWLLDPSVDLVGTFDHFLDHTIKRWRNGTK